MHIICSLSCFCAWTIWIWKRQERCANHFPNLLPLHYHLWFFHDPPCYSEIFFEKKSDRRTIHALRNKEVDGQVVFWTASVHHNFFVHNDATPFLIGTCSSDASVWSVTIIRDCSGTPYFFFCGTMSSLSFSYLFTFQLYFWIISLFWQSYIFLTQ